MGLTKWRYRFGYFKNLTSSQSFNCFSSVIPQSFLLYWHYICCLLSKWATLIEIARCTFTEIKLVFDLFSWAWSNSTIWGTLNCQYGLLSRLTFIKVALVVQKDSVQVVCAIRLRCNRRLYALFFNRYSSFLRSFFSIS